MKEYLNILRHTQLFAGVDEEELSPMLECLGARLLRFQKGQYVLCSGSHSADIMVLVEGCLHIRKDDYWGNRSILGHIEAGEMFGEVYLAPEGSVVLNDVVAVSDSAAICMDVKRIITTCPCACRFHSQVVRNLFYAISEKNRKLVQKISHMSRRTTREKLISYLSEESGRQNSSSFFIPFNRQQLADFLSVDRSAMSAELSKMRNEGMLTFDKNHFTLL